MARYYFELTEGDRLTTDTEVLDFGNLADATAEAKRALAEMGAERFSRDAPSALSLEIFSAEGRLLVRVVIAISVQSFDQAAA